MSKEKATIWFMDGEYAYYYDERKSDFSEDREGIVEILLVPSDSIRVKYGIEDERLKIDLKDDGRMGMWVEFKEEYLHWITRGVKFPKLVILCGFDGSPTDFMRAVDRENMMFLINNLRKNLWNYQILINEKEKIIKDLTHDKNEYVRSLMDLEKLKGNQTLDKVGENDG